MTNPPMHDMLDVVLLVEDNQDDAKLTVRAFKRNNLLNPIVVVKDGIEALDFLFAREAFSDRAGKPLPKLILLDLKLPKLGGLGVLKAIRADERTKHLPVVVLTSSKEEQDLSSAYALGANSYLLKSIDFAEFVEVARMLGFYWLTLNQSPLASD